MNYKINPIVLLVTSVCMGGLLQAQQSVNAGGGNATGSGGSVAYSIGQVFYNTHTSQTGLLAQGVQQAFEISVITLSKESTPISLQVLAYPNPTAETLTLQVSHDQDKNRSYQLVDVTGRVLETNTIKASKTSILMSHFSNATYFLKVLEDTKELQTFKIIKHQ